MSNRHSARQPTRPRERAGGAPREQAAGSGAKARWSVAVADADDFAAVVALARVALADPWSEESFREELDRAGSRILVARTGDQPGALPAGFLVTHRLAGELHILSLAVQPESRRLGIARALLRAVLRDAWSGDLDVAHLEVSASNEAAIALYESVGFEAVGIRRRYYRDGEDAILMTLFLDRADVRPGARTRESIE